MKKVKLLCVAGVAALAAGSAFAAQNVANTSQKGSLLIWPLITVQPPVAAITGSVQQSTLIEISNDANATVHVECYYVNERKGRVDFDFDLTAKQTACWDVYTREGDQVTPPKFPINTGVPGFAGNPFKGELICFATDPGREFQISWNHLTGTATVREGEDAFKYNAWSFAARNRLGVAAPNLVSAPHGVPGLLRLSGQNADGHYDGCPAYNIANFMPAGASLVASPPSVIPWRCLPAGRTCGSVTPSPRPSSTSRCGTPTSTASPARTTVPTACLADCLWRSGHAA